MSKIHEFEVLICATLVNGFSNIKGPSEML